MKNSTRVFAPYLVFLFLAGIVFTSFSIVQLKSKLKSPITNNGHGFTAESQLYHQGMITIKVKEGIGGFEKQSGNVSFNIASLDQLSGKYELSRLENRFKFNPKKLKRGMPDLSRIYRVCFPTTYSVREVVKAFSSDANIEYAEPIPIHRITETPDDALFHQCQHLPQIFALEAWEIHKGEDGAEEIIIAIVDVGIDWDHEDLLDNVWQNLSEDADGDGQTLEYIDGEWVLDPDDLNGIDDDSNGYVDDLIGWNFITNNGDPNPIPSNPVGFHGTHCGGISAGVTNNETGIASVSWNISLMGICADENNTLEYGYDGIIYAAESGADVISNSWSSFTYSEAEQEVIDYVTSLGSIVLGTTGNHNASTTRYPGGYPGVLSIAAVGVNDVKSSYSGYGLAVDIAAPGDIMSTVPNNDYELMSGTSMSCPLVAGCIGLLKSYHPEWSNEQLIAQLLGTADNIDTINPNYQHLLGAGRVNIFRMLSEENVTIPMELKLDLISATTVDDNNDSINAPGEEVTLSFEFRNFMPYVGEEDVTVSLQTSDDDIIIVDGSAIVDIPADGYFTIENQFVIQVTEDATSHYADIIIHFESNTPVALGNDIVFPLLVAPSGIYVFEGAPNHQDYSGTYITEFLEKLGYDYTYSNIYPATLLGFETVFLSHSDYDVSISSGTMTGEEHALVIQEFLEDGGNMYIEMNGLFIGLQVYGYPNYDAMKELLGVSSHTINFDDNVIDSLYGVTDTPMEGIYFTKSNQVHNSYIDNMEPSESAYIPFIEYEYGNVAVMNDGSSSYGHKSFYFGYSLAELIDTSPVCSRNNILVKTMEFFDYDLPDGYILSNFLSDKSIGGIPLVVQFTDISVSDPYNPVNSWQWDFDNDGNIDSYDQNPEWTYNSGGSYDVMLIVSNEINSDTIIFNDHINVNTGFLVYEGVANGMCHSGTFLSEYLNEHAHSHTYRNSFPESLEGFGAVFLSFGNWGSNYTEVTDQMAETIINYLQNGGYVYIEGGDVMGFDQVDNIEFLNLFGIEDAEDGSTNYIDSLAGQDVSITNGLLYTSSSQVTNMFIDQYALLPAAINAFEESNYGTVAVQHTGQYNQRTFCFAYTLAELDDGEYPHTREELLQRICNFFDIYTGTKASENIQAEFTIFPNPCTHLMNVRYQLKSESAISIQVYSINGQLIAKLINERQMEGEHQVEFDMQGIPSGIYLCVLHMDDSFTVQKIIKK